MGNSNLGIIQTPNLSQIRIFERFIHIAHLIKSEVLFICFNARIVGTTEDLRILALNCWPEVVQKEGAKGKTAEVQTRVVFRRAAKHCSQQVHGCWLFPPFLGTVQRKHAQAQSSRMQQNLTQ